MKFTLEIHRSFENTIIDYGIIVGDSTFILIKTGQNGSIYGYNNKYLELATTLNQKYGYTVVCSSNPTHIGTDALSDAINFIQVYAQEKHFPNYKIFFMGHSNGAYMGAVFGYKYPAIKRMLLINYPIQVNMHKVKNSLKLFNGEQVVLIFGERDTSFRYVPFLQQSLSSFIKIHTIPAADHNFTDMITEFQKLPEQYLLN